MTVVASSNISQPEETRAGLRFPRYFTKPDENPLTAVNWTRRSAVIRNESGDAIFEMPDVSAPEFWSDTAVNITASRYFRSASGTTERETGVDRLLLRVVGTIAQWGDEQGYFASPEDARAFHDELLHILLHQMASFNSPVWFNVGVDERPQCSACFILSVEDSMESILAWYTREGMIFKKGSGAGINLSKLRSSRERLSGGGKASGPISFMKAADASAGVIKSGGKSRRAAKMVILNADHPDILEFIRCKAREERKAHALIAAGYDPGIDGEAYSGVAFQNANHSVRVSDAFMEADRDGKEWRTRFVLTGDTADVFDARELMREIAEAAHACGDPGIQFDDEINRMHTCPETSPIRASNPCSEFMHVDDSACNLASIRLTAFLNEQGFDTDAFRRVIDILITAQDILVDKSSYPSEETTRNSHELRALGLGYADLGALLMCLAAPYDSEEARAWAATISAVLTGEAYLWSSRIAEIRGAFKGFPKNRSSMLRVLETHRERLENVAGDLVPEALFRTAQKVWDDALDNGRRFGYANCQVTALAPTGTIAFMMDCDTSGVEPEMALVKYKKLSGGGALKIVNRRVATALRRLGYTPEAVGAITEYIETTGDVEGAPHLDPSHLPLFDCALKSPHGGRFISSEGHVRMMAAIQPFISGAISKTVNLSNRTGVEDIAEIYRLAWRLGLKSISVYRDGCKAAQPVQTAQDSVGTGSPVRRRLPVDCRSVRHKFDVAGQQGYIHVGFYNEGQVGEIFIRIAKEGSTVSGLMDTIATLTSIALQYGVPLEALVNKFSHVRFEPSGFTGNPEIPIAKSLTDYIFRFLGVRFLSEEQQERAGIFNHADGGVKSTAPRARRSLSETGLVGVQSDAPACRDCGSIMVRSGSCYECDNCGSTSGCS